MKKINWREVITSCLVGASAIGLFLPLIIQLIIEPKIKSYQPIAFVRELSEEEKQKYHLFESVSGDYVQFRLLEKIVWLESNWKVNAIGDGGRAFGLAQFHKGTFNQFKEKAEMPELEYKNPYHQITLLVWAIENNLQSHWTTYKRAKKLSKI